MGQRPQKGLALATAPPPTANSLAYNHLRIRRDALTYSGDLVNVTVMKTG